MATYHYEKLGNEEIRLLVLEADGQDGRIRCSLRHVTLSSRPQFEAVSYTWEGQTADQPVECDGSTLLVTRNLFAALKRFRRKNTDRILWADAVCINQLDLTERSEQVQLMRHVYSDAEFVLAWLGEPSPTDAWAFATVEQLYANLTHIFPEYGLSRDNYMLWAEAEVTSGRDPSHATRMSHNEYAGLVSNISHLPEALRALQTLCSRSWFRRLCKVDI